MPIHFVWNYFENYFQLTILTDNYHRNEMNYKFIRKSCICLMKRMENHLLWQQTCILTVRLQLLGRFWWSRQQEDDTDVQRSRDLRAIDQYARSDNGYRSNGKHHFVIAKKLLWFYFSLILNIYCSRIIHLLKSSENYKFFDFESSKKLRNIQNLFLICDSTVFFYFNCNLQKVNSSWRLSLMNVLVRLA